MPARSSARKSFGARRAAASNSPSVKLVLRPVEGLAGWAAKPPSGGFFIVECKALFFGSEDDQSWHSRGNGLHRSRIAAPVGGTSAGCVAGDHFACRFRYAGKPDVSQYARL